MRFAAGHWLYLLALAPVLWLWLRRGDGVARRRLGALLGSRAGEHVEDLPPAARTWRRFFALAGLVWLVVALARPQWGANEVVVQQRGTDVVIALDISNSMRAEDVVPSRLARARAELGALLEDFDRGRVGLVLFAGQAFVQCPLTLDLGTAQLFLRMADPDMISTQGTALGAALTVSLGLLESGADAGDAASRRAILLVTDGEDLEGGWQEAAALCRERGVSVIPVGVGEETGGLIPLPADGPDADPAGAGYLKDEQGQVVMSRLDVASLQRLAEHGEGVVFRIGAAGLDVEAVRALIAGLGERELDGRHVSRYQERFVWPLGLAFACLWAWTLVRARPPLRTALVALLCLAAAAPGAQANVLRPDGAAAAERGLDHYLAGDYEAALGDFLEARALAPDDPRLALAVGAAMSRLGRHEDAAREYARVPALTDDPQLHAEALYNSGTDALSAGDPAAAIEQLRRALSLEPDRLDTLRNLEYAVRMMEQAPPQQQEQDGQDQQNEDQQDQDQQDQQQQDQDQQNQDQQNQDRQGEEEQGQEQQDQEQQDEAQQDQEQQDEAQQDQEQQDQPQEEQAQEEQPQPRSEEEISKERALSILKALDRDEEELRRSLQKRLKGAPTSSGKRW